MRASDEPTDRRRATGGPPRAAGFAMPLVMLAVAMAIILALGFLKAHSTTVPLSRNVAAHPQARHVAETGLELTIAYVKQHDWRAERSEGVWASEVPFAGGTYTIRVQDGKDTDGDGTVEGDGNLSDDETDPATITATGRHDGVAHTVRAVLEPAGGSAGGDDEQEETGDEPKLVLVTPDADSPPWYDRQKHTTFASWGYTVEWLEADASPGTYRQKVGEADVVYVSEQVSSGEVSNKLTDLATGVVSEEGYLNDEIELASADGPSYRGHWIDVTDASHPITKQLGTGWVHVSNGQQYLRRIEGDPADGLGVLATERFGSARTLAAIDRGQPLSDGDPAPARRVILPWGDNNFRFDRLSHDGRTLLKESLKWARGNNKKLHIHWLEEP